MNAERQLFVEREISRLTLATHLVETMVSINAEYPHSDNDFNYENMQNMYQYVCDDCGQECTLSTVECQSCGSEDITNDIKEPLEWWIVDGFIFDQLHKLDEVLLRANGLLFWGRTTSGQAISQDGTFQRIYDNLQG